MSGCRLIFFVFAVDMTDVYLMCFRDVLITDCIKENFIKNTKLCSNLHQIQNDTCQFMVKSHIMSVMMC